MNAKLRVGNTLGEVFRMYRDRAGTLLPVGFWLFLISTIVEDTAGRTLLFPIALVVGLAVPTLYEGIAIGMVRDDRDGGSSSVRELAGFVVPVLPQLVGATFLLVIGVLAGLVLLIVPGLYLLTIWFVVSPVILIERAAVFAAFGRSRQLVRGSGWAVFGIAIIALALPPAVAVGLGFALGGIFNGVILQAILGVLLATVTAPIPSLAAGVLYYRLRDIEPAPALDNQPAPA
jgi:hypothetical protein